MFILGKFGFVYFGYGCLFGKNIIAINSNIIYSSTFYLPFLLIGLHFIYRYLSLKRFDRRLLFLRLPFQTVLRKGQISSLHDMCSYLLDNICCIDSVSFSYWVNLWNSNATCRFRNTMGVSQRFSGYLSEYGIRRLNAEMNIDAIEYLVIAIYLCSAPYFYRTRITTYDFARVSSFCVPE